MGIDVNSSLIPIDAIFRILFKEQFILDDTQDSCQIVYVSQYSHQLSKR